MTQRRACVLAAFTLCTVAPVAAAHGIGGRGDLPIPKEFFVWSAAAAVAASFLLAANGWRTPRLGAGAGGVAAPRWVPAIGHWLAPIVRVVGIQVFVVVLLAGWFGVDDAGENVAPVALYIVLWVVMLWASALVGDIWRPLNPWDSIAAVWDGFRPTPDPHPTTRALVWSHWPAAIGVAAFTWLELAYHEPSSPRVVAVALTVYSVVVLAMALRFGRRWIQTGEMFTVIFSLAAAMAPVHRRADGTLALRAPFVGLTALVPRRGTLAVVLVLLGGTTFDGVTRTPWWGSVIRLSAGWERTMLNTLGLAGTIGAVAVGYLLASSAVARLGAQRPLDVAARYAHTLVPIAFAYSIAHYFSLVVFDGQGAYRLMSDPFGRGWDIFGTADHRVDYLWLTTGTIATVATVAMVVGHVAAIVLAHEETIVTRSRRSPALVQLPMALVMVAFTVTGLTLLLSV